MKKRLTTLFLVVALSAFGIASVPADAVAGKGGGIKKGCPKGNGKKTGCKKNPSRLTPAPCPALNTGEKGSGKPTIVVTDTATEQQPVIQKVNLSESIADADLVGSGVIPPGSDAFNVQVDTANADAGLHVLLEFPSRRDYDLEMLWSDGSYAARSHDFNPAYSPVPESYSNGGHAGEATDSSEHIVGVRTADCGGFTIETVNWLGEGGEFEVKVWLGDVVNDPQAPGEEPPA